MPPQVLRFNKLQSDTQAAVGRWNTLFRRNGLEPSGQAFRFSKQRKMGSPLDSAVPLQCGFVSIAPLLAHRK